MDMAAWQAQLEGRGVSALRQYVTQTLGEKMEWTSGYAVTPSELRQCAKWLQERREKDSETPTVSELLRRGGGARVVPRATTPEEEPSEARKNYLEKRRQKLLRLDEEMRYKHLVHNVKTQTASKELQRNLTSVRQHLSIGANMIVSRIVAFVVIYMVSRSLTDNETVRVIAGLGGAIGMMFIEMVLFIARAAKYDAIEQQQQKKREGAFD